MDIQEHMEQIYRDRPLEEIPWNRSEPPRLLIEAVKAGKISPCKAVDLGCGAGNYAVWLAGQGFDVTGIDLSKSAVGHAEDLAARQGVSCRFVAADLLGDLSDYHAKFDLAYDWGVLHHVFPEHRSQYLQNVHDMLRPKGTYLSVSFNEKDSGFDGQGKIRGTRLGTSIYFSSEDELRSLFESWFEVLDLTVVEIHGRFEPHLANAAWLQRR